MSLLEVELRLDRRQAKFAPGELLTGSYRLPKWQQYGLRAVELSVLWHTIGKGDQDLGIIHFQRIPLEPEPELDVARAQYFDIPLPLCPLSYEGVAVKVRWSVRLRLFLPRGREHIEEAAFQLGDVPPAALPSEKEGTQTEERERDE